MSSKSRRRFGAEQKARIVRRHLADKVPVSDLADEFGIQPSQIHTWVRLVLAQAEKAFERSNGRRRSEVAKDALREVDAAGQEGPPGEFPRLGRPGAMVQQQAQDAAGAYCPSMALDFDDILTGVAAG